MGMALIKNGYNCNSGDPAEVEKATKSLLDLKPHVAKFTTDLGPGDRQRRRLADGGLDDADLPGPGAEQAPGELSGSPCRRTGRCSACDTLSVGANAKAPGTALLFMDWMMRHDNNFELGQVHAPAHRVQGRRRRL